MNDLKPIPWEPSAPAAPIIPVGEAKELPDAFGWLMWDIAQREQDREEVRAGGRGLSLQKSC